MLLTLAVLQAVAIVVLALRLLPGRRRFPPVAPMPTDGGAGELSILVATLNEAHRIEPCLAGLTRQDATVREILVVDSGSTDGTQALVMRAARKDPRVQLLRDEPLPAGWVGKVWALQHGLERASGEWILGIDADTIPEPGMAAGALSAALTYGYDAASFAPRFRIASAAERWLQPSLLVTLVYRFGAAGTEASPERVMANGQCFLARRSVLEAEGGYTPARTSFSDDVTLARHLARTGHRVGFLDGSRLYAVRSYSSATEAWREWGRSLDLKDSTTRATQWWDVAFLGVVQGTPIPAVLIVLALGLHAVPLLATCGVLLAIRIAIMGALMKSYEVRGAAFWLSPLADPLAALRIVISTVSRARTWRGRAYSFPA